jgi:hypothetical protein
MWGGGALEEDMRRAYLMLIESDEDGLENTYSIKKGWFS